ncbi:dentin sialophosphoprotein isoform X2 [Ceratina calcarata]|uniref:Dentin sialophosphoprotein isoform X2 n=1 Tax=Ceratina calcarata TaxID=156304 RepID=A0AAJ7JBP0_9HYME|nr:dentin sialophosphoprotein isoform X2 [Ceratina calcarata]
MAWTGTQRWRNPAPEGDDVQRSIELLDKVLSEYDEHEAEGEGGGGAGSGAGVGDCGSTTEPTIALTPDDESPSLGHQSEDDGYMSMNGRKAKMALVALRPVPDCPEPQDLAGISGQEFPPPPEEAERIISTLLPMVSPSNSSKRSSHSSGRRSGRQQWMEDSIRCGNDSAVTTQTTLPKTRHQRPYGWENGTGERNSRLVEPPSPPSKFASLPYDGKVSFGWIPPRTNPTTVEKHREVRRRSSEEEELEGNGKNHHRQSYEKDRASTRSRKQRQSNEITKSSSVEDRLLMNHEESEQSGARRRNDSDSSEDRFSRNSESERSSIPRSSSVSVERFSMRATCGSSDFSRANSTSNERFNSDFSIAVASASSNDRVSMPTSDPFSIRNLDFVSFSLPTRADSNERFSAPTSDRCSEERYSDVFSTRNSDFSTRNSTDFRTQSEEERFSDDSLEELLPPPPAISKRHSIAWEVSLEDDPLYAPGSTKVIGRRRRKSSDVSSVGSASKLRDFDDWQDPRLSTTDDDLVSPYSDSSTNELDQIRPQELTKNGTYVIRRGRKKERKSLPKPPTKTKSLSFDNSEENRLSDGKRYSSTFDNIRSLLRDNKMNEPMDDAPAVEYAAAVPPDLVRVVSLPAINDETGNWPRELEVTVEEEESSDLSDKDKKTRETSSSLSSNDKPSRGETNHGSSSACNGVSLSASNSYSIGFATGGTADEPTAPRKSPNPNEHRHASKIPVNLLIEDQIVKKALKENRRQLEKVSDAIKEIESVKNSESYSEGKQRWTRTEDTRQGRKSSLESESNDRERSILLDSRCKKQQLDSDLDSDTASKTSPETTDIEGRRANGTELYSSGKRQRRQNGVEGHKNDQKQIENVIDAILEDSKNPDFQVSVEVLEFPPLPPSPVEEADEECADIGQSSVIAPKPKASNRTMEYRPRVPPHRAPIANHSFSDSKDQQTSLNTRSMDAGFTRGKRTPTATNSRREQIPVERRTLPTDLPGPSRRRPFTKRHSPSSMEPCSSAGNGSCANSVTANGASNSSNNNGSTIGNMATGSSGMQTSCSLPETPVFARGSDIPRTPQHASNPTQMRRQPGLYAPTMATTGYRRNNPGLEQAIIGTELLRLAGGPNRGWYPTRKANQPRPASIEHLERLNNAYDPRLAGTGDQRKPLTLPTNITPNKYFGQSKHSSASSTREALRRVTSLLIKKGSGSKDGKSGKDNASPCGPYAAAECGDAPKKKGFFKGFWKRSRHYSLENQ